jgi:tetratricopeptide (TPR) repeat protein
MTGTGPTRGPGIRSGAVPVLADGFISRPDSVPDLAALVPGTAVALASTASGQPTQPSASCGKTQLAVQAAHALWHSGQVEVLAWIDASSRAAALSGYTQAAAAAGIDPVGSAEQVASRMLGWLGNTTRPWLIVLDDLQDAADLDRLWPRGPAGRIVITTPDEQTVSGECGGLAVQVVGVGPLSTREALSYLMDRLADDPDQRHGAIDLALALDGDPLALTHASAVITTAIWDCAHYQRHYTDLRARLAEQADGEPPAPATVTWRLSAERAAQLCPGEAPAILLALAALLDGQAIPAALFTTPAVCAYLTQAGTPATGPDSAWQAVRALEHTGLLTTDLAPAPPIVRVSRAAAADVRATIPSPMLGRAAIVTADALAQIWPQTEPQPWLAERLRSCADALHCTAGDRLWTADACHPLLLKTGHSLDTAALTGPAVRHWTQLAATSQRILGPDTPHTLTIGSHLADALLAAGQATEATACWQWVTTGRSRTIGPEHPDALTATVGLGRAMTVAGQPGHAVAILEQSLTDHERVRGPDHPDTITARGALAAACQAVGLSAQATGHYRHILASQERRHGTRHPATMAARSQLAAACLDAGQHKDAIGYYKKTLADRQHTLGADHPDTIAARRDLAAACMAAGKIAAALQLHEQTCASHEQSLGTDHPTTLTARADLASVYLAAGRLADAAATLRDTLTRCENALAPEAPLTTEVRQALTGLARQ